MGISPLESYLGYEASAAFRVASQIDPARDAPRQFGMAFLNKGAREHAVECFRTSRGLGMGPSVEGLMDMASDAEKKENYNKAKQLCHVGLELEPDCGPLHLQMGHLLRADGSFQKACDCFRRSNELSNEPTAKDVITLGDEVASGGEGCAAADVFFRLAIDLDPRSSAAHRRLAEHYERYCFRDKAIEEYRIAAKSGCKASQSALEGIKHLEGAIGC